MYIRSSSTWTTVVHWQIEPQPSLSAASGSNTVSTLARFNSNPGIAHWKAAKHLLCYLKGTVDLRLTYRPDLSLNAPFVAFCDAAHGDNPDNGW